MTDSNHSGDDLLGRRLGSYRLTALLGRSKLSAVYRATDIVLGRDVAVKVLLSGKGESDRRRQDQFVSEARSAAQLQHPHVVTIHHIGQEDDLYYVVMEFMAGGSLQDVLDRDQRLSPTAAATAIRQAARGLAAAHRAGMIHRDLKPSNLLMTEEGVVKVADFGLANQLEIASESGKSSVVEGTPRYLAPELCLGHPASLSSDVYGLGMTWYALLNGAPAFGGKNSQEIFRKHLRCPVPDISQSRPDVPLAHAGAIEQSLAKLPEDRQESGIAFLDAVEGMMNPAEQVNTSSGVAGESASLRDLITASRDAAVQVRQVSMATTMAVAAAKKETKAPSVLIPATALAVLSALIILAVVLFWRLVLSG